MEDIAFSDWPEQAVDLSGTNPWLPAYGFQAPSALLDKEDFLGNPDAHLFLNGGAGQHYIYLETIQEETSDDLRSESDVSESRTSPVGWLATDSESGSVIRIENLDEIDSGSEREIACPSKRRRQDNNLLCVSDDDSNQSLSRSSSLIQFESLEKQCQDISSSSPSVFSSFSFDSLERKNDLSPDSLDAEPESDYYKTLKIDLPKATQKRRDRTYGAEDLSSSSESADSEDTLDTAKYDSCRSVNLKTWRSFDGIHANSNVVRAVSKVSSENLSEDSGFGDTLCQFARNKSSSIPNIAMLSHSATSDRCERKNQSNLEKYRLKNCTVGFEAYDGETFQNFTTAFGASYQDLSIFDKYDFGESKSPLVERYARSGGAARRHGNDAAVAQSNKSCVTNFKADVLIIEKVSECARPSKYKTQTSSEPNLLASTSISLANRIDGGKSSVYYEQTEQRFFEGCVCVSSVPKDLNLIGEKCGKEFWNLNFANDSIAAKNWDLTDIAGKDGKFIDSSSCTGSKKFVEQLGSESVSYRAGKDALIVGNSTDPENASLKTVPEAKAVAEDTPEAVVMEKRSFKKRAKQQGDKVFISLRKRESSSESEPEINYKREGSYMEAMANMIDMSDDERNPCYRDGTHKTTIVEFDRKILKAISETSINLNSSADKLDLLFSSTPLKNRAVDAPDAAVRQKAGRSAATPFASAPISSRNVKSTPNLAAYKSEEAEKRLSLLEMPRKSSLVNRSTSTSGVSDSDTLTPTRSFCGSTGSKGVHFCPVVSEVNWRDSVSTERESYSLSSTPEIEKAAEVRRPQSPPLLIRPEPRIADRFYASQPELQAVKPEALELREADMEYTFVPLQPRQAASQQDMCDGGRGGRSGEADGERAVAVNGCRTAEGGENGLKRSFVPTKLKQAASQPDVTAGTKCQGQLIDEGDVDQKVVANSFAPLRTKHASSPDISSVKRRNSQIRKDPDGSVAYVDEDGVSYRHTHLGSVYKSSPTTSSHVRASNKQEVAVQKPVVTMESPAARQDAKPAHKTRKLGGFFSRIASFRFSSRKGADDKGKQKKKTRDAAPNSPSPVGQRPATKDDYIFIPLKGPPATDAPSNNNDAPGARPDIAKLQVDGRVLDENACLSSKPPLPKLPPRVVGASVKRKQEAAAHPAAPERRNIDSGDAVPRPMEPMGLIETDLDTEVTVITSGAHVKTRSLMNLGDEAAPRSLAAPPHPARPHKSMEFLLDKQNLKVVEPPENELQKGERVMSEHQLRVQRSLQKLTVPDWYKQAEVPREGFLLKKPACRDARWTGTGSKTTSLNSLGSSSQSPVVLSPTPQNQPFVRWSTSKLNSTASSPCASTRSSFNAKLPNGSISPSSLRSSFSYRQPYLGWRSQERLTRPRTPAERLANTLLGQGQQPQESPEIQTSIKEVTLAIAHYVSGLKPEDAAREHQYDSQETASQRSKSASPRGSQKLCWLESSFVGTRPLDSPQTPVTLAESQTSTPAPPNSLRLDLQTHNDFSLLNTGNTTKPSPGSTTLEDVLDSLLGLPSATRAPSPSLQETVSANTSPVHENDTRITEQFRRRSEGSEPSSRPSSIVRRVSFHSSPVLRCRYSRCGRVAVATSAEGQAFKNCHNCSYTYCSRACRRAHWEKHRKTCLFSRVGTLCRQVIAACKEKPETLHHLSVIARRGFLSHGLGAVKCFFPTPEAAENFLTEGLDCLGEPTYICWKDLLPSEMGTPLYTELVKMCKSYNPDSKLVLYVSVCVVSEAPTAGSVKWERQLVSRCAKLRLSKDVHIPEKDVDAPETLILTSKPLKDEPRQRHNRELSFKNIQRHLHQRGVSLKRHYPEVYQQLSKFVEGNCQTFKAVTVYPRDNVTGKTFMCIIMPESEPENLEKVVKAGVRVRTIDVLKE